MVFKTIHLWWSFLLFSSVVCLVKLANNLSLTEGYPSTTSRTGKLLLSVGWNYRKNPSYESKVYCKPLWFWTPFPSMKELMGCLKKALSDFWKIARFSFHIALCLLVKQKVNLNLHQMSLGALYRRPLQLVLWKVKLGIPCTCDHGFLMGNCDIVCLLGGQHWQNHRGGGQGGGRGGQGGARGGVQGFSRGGGQGGTRGGGRGRGNQQGTGFNYQQQSSSNRGGRGRGRGSGANNQSWNQEFSYSYTQTQAYPSSSYGDDDSFQWNSSGGHSGE